MIVDNLDAGIWANSDILGSPPGGECGKTRRRAERRHERFRVISRRWTLTKDLWRHGLNLPKPGTFAKSPAQGVCRFDGKISRGDRRAGARYKAELREMYALSSDFCLGVDSAMFERYGPNAGPRV